MSIEAFSNGLGKYIPSNSIETVYRWLQPHRVKLKISKPRTSKLGDFRVLSKNGSTQISVNGNLNKYSFLITLTHEIAHLKDFEARKTLREAHGTHWKSKYKELLLELRKLDVFPEDILHAIDKHIRNPKAASCSDPRLLEALRKYDAHQSLRLKDLHDGAHFILPNGRKFLRGELRRTRYKCQEITTKKWFLVHGEAEVSILPN